MGKTRSRVKKVAKNRSEATRQNNKRSIELEVPQAKRVKNMEPSPCDNSTAPSWEYEEQKGELNDEKDKEDMDFDDDDCDGDWGSDGDWGDLDEDQSGNIPEQVQKEKVKNYSLLLPDEIAKLRQSDIDKVSNLVFNKTDDESRDKSSALLSLYKWNTQKLTEDFFGNPDGILKEAGIQKTDSTTLPSSTSETLVECPQCYEDVPQSTMFSLRCGHQSCTECWSEYLEFHLKNGVNGLNTRCNFKDCKLVVTDSIWRKFLTVEAKAKRLRWQMQSYVQNHRDIAWCPGRDCGKAIKSLQRDGDGTEVTCSCGYAFCFKCKEVAHRPAPCKWARSWIIKCSSEAENATWILANTKRCPKCDTQIEKNQGCNHMKCSNCRFEFCWLCKGKWSEHGSATGGYYRCNKYEEAKKAGSKSKEDRESEVANNALQKYLFYYSRFDNHGKSRDVAKKVLEKTGERMTALRALKGGGFNDVSFLEDAVKTVIECRRVLQWTYAMGYYLKPGQEKNLFEHLQEMLEKNTEHLHGLSERNLEDLVDDKTRSDINNYTRVTNTFLGKLITGIEEDIARFTKLFHSTDY